MKFCRIVQKKRVFSTAMKLARSARREIIVTMDVDEEMQSPLPSTYDRLIARKVREGVVVKRFGFGSKRTFTKLAKQYTGIQFVYAGDMRVYQRMLIVDRKRGMFELGGKIFYTEFPPLIESLVNYIEIIYNKPA